MEYKINPQSVRNFTRFVITKDDNDKLKCADDDSTDFLHDLISLDDTGLYTATIKEPLIVDSHGIILDGNIRYFLLGQLKRYNVKVNPVPVNRIDATDDDLFLYQIKSNTGNRISVRERLKAIGEYIDHYTSLNPSIELKALRRSIKEKYGDTTYHYACLYDRYQALPKWLKQESDKLNVNPSISLKFFNNFGDDRKSWGKVVRDAIHTSKNKLAITTKNLENIKALPKSEHLLNDNVDTQDLTEDELKELALSSFKQIQEIVGSVNIDKYECRDWKKFLRVIDEFLYIIENV